MKKTRDELIREVANYVDEAIRKNVRSEWMISGLLVVQFVTGIALLVIGAALGHWAMLAPGGLFTAMLWWPIGRLVELRANNLRLQLLPELLRLAETKEAKRLASLLVEKLIDKLEAK